MSQGDRARGIIDSLFRADNVIELDMDAMRAECEAIGTTTEHGNLDFFSCVRNRSASLTVYIGGEDVELADPSDSQRMIMEEVDETLDELKDYLKRVPLQHVEFTMGDNKDFAPRCHMFLSRLKPDYVRLAYMAARSYFVDGKSTGDELFLVNLPEWHERKRRILTFPHEGVTFVLGSDYYGEVKKGFLRMGMWSAKQKGMLGLHAGAKTVTAMGPNGSMSTMGVILFGLTATGKTTHTCHDHGLTGKECISILQDDVVFLKPDCGALGTEMGFYIKTDGLDPVEQPLLHSAACRPDALLDNVLVDHEGKVLFRDVTLTGNGRAVVQASSLGDVGGKAFDLPPLGVTDKLVVLFITRRNTILPIISRLSNAQAAGAFMLGESVESSGGDPTRAGESVRVVGTNPFIIGDLSEEGNWFQRFLDRHGDSVECYLLNTGGVGELMETDPNGRKRVVRKVERVQIPEVATMVRGICRGSIEWDDEPLFGTRVPVRVDGVDMGKYDPRRYYDDDAIGSMAKALREERYAYLSSFEGLDPRIREAYRSE